MSYNDFTNTNTVIIPTYDFSVPYTTDQHMLSLYGAVLSGNVNAIIQNLNNTPILVITNNIRYFSALLFSTILKNRPEILDIFIEYIKKNELGIEKFFDGTYGDLVCATVCANATECFLLLLSKYKEYVKEYIDLNIRYEISHNQHLNRLDYTSEDYNFTLVDLALLNNSVEMFNILLNIENIKKNFGIEEKYIKPIDNIEPYTLYLLIFFSKTDMMEKLLSRVCSLYSDDKFLKFINDTSYAGITPFLYLILLYPSKISRDNISVFLKFSKYLYSENLKNLGHICQLQMDIVKEILEKGIDNAIISVKQLEIILDYLKFNLNTGIVHEIINNNIKEIKKIAKKAFEAETHPELYDENMQKNYPELYDRKIPISKLRDFILIVTSGIPYLNIIEIEENNFENYMKNILFIFVQCINTQFNPKAKKTTPLHYSYRYGFMDIVYYLISQGANIEAEDEYGKTILHYACEWGHLPMVEYLISQGANIEIGNLLKKTPLHYACKNGHLPIVECLISHGADIEAKDKYKWGPLHCACYFNCPNIVEYLITKGANIEAKNKDEETPLHSACQNGHLSIVKYLISKGADIEEKDNEGRTSLILAIISNSPVYCYLLSKGANIEAKDRCGWTPLHYACMYNNLDMVKYLIEKSVDKEAKDEDDHTPLHYAYEENYLPIVDYLISKGANMEEITDVDKQNLLFFTACKEGYLYIVKCLISQGADIEAKDMNENTPLHYVCFNGNLPIVKYLIEKGANVEAKNKDGETPLHYACFFNHLDIVKYLISQGADIEAKDNEGKTSLILTIINYSPIDCYLLSKGANIEAKDEGGWTPLHYACKYDKFLMVRSLVEKGANKMATTNSGLTPLMVASDYGCIRIADFLKRAINKDQQRLQNASTEMGGPEHRSIGD